MTRLLRALTAAATIAVAAALAATAQAQSGGNANAIASGNYLDGSTWDTGATPAADQDAQVADNFNVSIGTGDVAQGFRVIIGQSATAGDVGTLTMTGGTLNTDRVLSLGGFENAATLVGKGIFNQSGGEVFIDAITPGAGFAGISVGDAGAGQGEYNLSGGTMNMPGLLQVAVGPDSVGTVNQTGGTINAANMEIGRNGQGSYDFSSGAVNLSNFFGVGANRPALGTVTQTGGTLSAAFSEIGVRGRGSYTMSGGNFILTDATRALTIGLDGNAGGAGGIDAGEGTLNHSGGTITAEGDLRVGNGDFSEGVYNLSGSAVTTIGGDLHIVSNTTVGGVTPSNASGELNLLASSASISVAGDLNANGAGSAGDASNASLLNYTVDAGGVSTISVGGIADIDAAIFDILETAPVPVGSVFDLIASQSIANFATASMANNAYALQLSGGGAILQAVKVVPEPATLMLAGLAGLSTLAWFGRRK